MYVLAYSLLLRRFFDEVWFLTEFWSLDHRHFEIDHLEVTCAWEWCCTDRCFHCELYPSWKESDPLYKIKRW